MDELIVISKSDLKNLLREIIRQEIQNYKPEDCEVVLNSEEVITLLKISKGYLITLRKEKGLPHYSLGTGSGAIRYKRNEILAWMATLKK